MIALDAMADMQHSGLMVETLNGVILNHVDRGEKGFGMLDRFGTVTALHGPVWPDYYSFEVETSNLEPLTVIPIPSGALETECSARFAASTTFKVWSRGRQQTLEPGRGYF